MASKSLIKDVPAGLVELSTTEAITGISAGEYAEFELNSETTVDDMYGQVSGAEDEHALLLIKYPATGVEGIIKTIQFTGGEDTFFLNSADENSGTGKLWYRVPARAKLQIKAHPDNASAITVHSFMALCRGGA